MDNFASLDTPGDSGGVKVVELSAFEKYISCFVTDGAAPQRAKFAKKVHKPPLGVNIMILN